MLPFRCSQELSNLGLNKLRLSQVDEVTSLRGLNVPAIVNLDVVSSLF